MTAQEIRKQFLDYFETKKHKIVPSVPIVVKNDPTLLFINAGMNPFKDIFLGNAPAQHARIADTQKCLRVSGKHNDLEEVGVDTYHHTFFEMLGNWSFGDYFKEEAIQMAWELLTEVYKLPKDRLYVTVFEGDASENLQKDTESEAIWKKYIAEDRILLGNKKDNFWEMGDVGPCGPCTEIHFDSRTDEARAEIDGKQLVNADDPNVIEIWNNVFMEFNRKTDKSLEPLPAKHVDTGMGFERLVRVIQGKSSNYDTDIFMPLIQYTESLCQKKYTFSDSKEDISFRVIADHIRAISSTIADGQLPSNTGAGYVIRRILRRAVRYGYSFLNFQTPFLHQLVPVLSAQFKDVFPEMEAQKQYIAQVIKEEESSFFATLSKGIKIFEQLAQNATKNEISGIDAFTLFDTYGFPIDLTRLLAQEIGLSVNETEFESSLNEQKNRSKNATKLETEDWIVVHSELDGKPSDFIGYDFNFCEAKIVKYRKVSNKSGIFYQLVLNITPFYAESGGQVGDSGILNHEGAQITIINTVKENDTIFHLTKSMPEIDLTKSFQAQIDTERRFLIANNHTATHLLQAALRNLIGSHVEQKGSLVNEHLLRFDFSHFSKLTQEEIEKIEFLVNEKINEAIELTEERQIPIDEAKQRGVMALFGEKYGEIVRVITFDKTYSQELCGGTHAKNTKDLIHFKIISESSIAAGIRRIEAITSNALISYFKEKETDLNQVVQLLKNTSNPIQSIQNLIQDNASARKQIELYELYIAKNEAKRIVDLNANFIEFEFSNSDLVKNIATLIRSSHSNIALVITYLDSDKRKVALCMGDEKIQSQGLKANELAKALGNEFKGGGGGQPGFSVVSLPKETDLIQIQNFWNQLINK
jgi:alanyl-tRNA synthetase